MQAERSQEELLEKTEAEEKACKLSKIKNW